MTDHSSPATLAEQALALLQDQTLTDDERVMRLLVKGWSGNIIALLAARSETAPHERGALLERVAKALCRYGHPERSLEESVSPSRQLWQRFIPEAEVVLEAIGTPPSATVALAAKLNEADATRYRRLAAAAGRTWDKLAGAHLTGQLDKAIDSLGDDE